MKNKIGSITNYLAAISDLAFGLIYLFRRSFMPYHSQAISLQWSEVDKNIQFLILALMRVASGGFIVGAIVVIWLQYKFTETKLKWIPTMILIVGTVSALITLYATLIVKVNTPGNPPIAVVIVILLLLFTGYVFNRKYIQTN